MYISDMAAVHLTIKDFADKIKTGVVFVDFWAEWCGPCRMAAPIIEELATEYAGKALIAKVDVDADPQLSGDHGVMSIPTCILFKDGKEIGRQVGFAGKQGYIDLLKKAGV